MPAPLAQCIQGSVDVSHRTVLIAGLPNQEDSPQLPEVSEHDNTSVWQNPDGRGYSDDVDCAHEEWSAGSDSDDLDHAGFDARDAE